MYQYAARLARVIDGDTVVLDVDLGFHQWRLNQSYRLNRIDAPELRVTPAGPDARRALTNFLTGKALVAHTARSDSFGRWLVELYADNANVSDWLVANGYATYRSYE